MRAIVGSSFAGTLTMLANATPVLRSIPAAALIPPTWQNPVAQLAAKSGWTVLENVAAEAVLPSVGDLEQASASAKTANQRACMLPAKARNKPNHCTRTRTPQHLGLPASATGVLAG